MESKEKLATQIVHFGRRNNKSGGDVRLPIRTSITFAQKDTKTLVDTFQGRRANFTYARNSSPTPTQLEQLVTTTEEGIQTVCFSSGMAAIVTPILSLIKAGDHVIAGNSIFGNTLSFFKTLERLGISVSLVETSDANQVSDALQENTKLFFFETISNPTTKIPDLENLSALLAGKNIISIADNTITTAMYYSPKKHGFTFAHHSLSKYFGGHAVALAGSITDLGNYNWQQEKNILELYKKRESPSAGILQIRKKGMRDMGPSLGAHDAEAIVMGAETLELRMQRHSENALAIARFLKSHPKVSSVNYPGLESHPQHKIAKKLFSGYSGLMSFTLSKELDPIKLLDHFNTIIPATHLGDTRSLAIPVAKTIFYEIGAQRRREAGIDENLIRLSVGIENIEDLQNDISFALEKM